MNKYLCSYDNTSDTWSVVDDDPDYDGPESNIGDPIDVYHIEAASPEEAISIAKIEKAIDD